MLTLALTSNRNFRHPSGVCGLRPTRSEIGPVTGGWNSPSIWQATKKSSSARLDRIEPEGMDRATIPVGLIEGTGRELLDDPVEEILAELHFPGPSARPDASTAEPRMRRGIHRLRAAIALLSP